MAVTGELYKHRNKFRYVYSCDLDTDVQIKIGTLEGSRLQPSYKDLVDNPILKFSGLYSEQCSDLYVTCQVFADGKALALPVRTSYKAFTTRWNWNEWLKLPVKYRDLPRNAVLVFTVWDLLSPCQATVVGGTTIPLFDTNGTLRQSMQDLRVWPNVPGDGSVPTSTPGDGEGDTMSRLAKLCKKHRDGHMVKVDWLDRLTFREVEVLNERENLDLKLTPYNVLATSTRHGFVQFVQDSVPVAEVLEKEGSILNYFRKHSTPTGDGPVPKEVLDTYVKSCAGYCVITYLLGVGDRHLDNLLLTTSGNIVHIDFGYILGRDPKPLPPPMKLSREMVEAMGGTQADHFQEFKKLCYTAFLHLRRSSNLILNLFALMVDANVPDIALEPDKTVKKVQDKFRLELSDEEAVHHMQTLIDVSVAAVMAALVEQIHKIAQYWRK